MDHSKTDHSKTDHSKTGHSEIHVASATSVVPFDLPEPVKVDPLTVEQANLKEHEVVKERETDIENFQQNHFNQHFNHQQQLPIPQQLPPAPTNLPQINYQQQMQQAQYQGHGPPVNAWAHGPPSTVWYQPQVQQGYIHLPTPWQQPPLPEYLDPRKSIDLKLIRKPKKKDKRCYTCKPRGKVKHHVIITSDSGNFTFHHDMHKRPVIIITPTRHIEQFYELSPEEQVDFFKSLKEFTEIWNIKDYQTSINFGTWQDSNHSHLHCKIRIAEKLANRLRRDHFEKLKLEKRYTEVIGPKNAPVSKN